MLFLLVKSVYIFIMVLVLAILEVQIEGKQGWAANLPTWRPNSNEWYVKWYKKFMHEKEMTGYHLSLFFFLLLFFHLPFFMDGSWNIIKELDILAIYFLFVVVWDYLWFVVNPHFTIKNFRSDYNFWHKKWLGGLPVDYWFCCFISLLIALIITFFFDGGYIFEWIVMFSIFVILTAITKLFIKKFKPEWE